MCGWSQSDRDERRRIKNSLQAVSQAHVSSARRGAPPVASLQMVTTERLLGLQMSVTRPIPHHTGSTRHEAETNSSSKL